MFFRMAPPFLLFLSKNRSTATNNISKQDLEVASMLGLMWGIDRTILRCCAVNINRPPGECQIIFYNFLGPVNSSVIYSLSTGISVRESTFDFWFHFSLWRSTLNIDFWFCVLTFGGHCRPPKLSEVDRWWAKRKMPWALFAVKKLKLPWVNWNCREQIEIAVSKLKLPWVNWNCREQIEIAVNKLKLPWVKLKLPWVNWNCPGTNWNCLDKLKLPWVKLKLPWHFWAIAIIIIVLLLSLSSYTPLLKVRLPLIILQTEKNMQRQIKAKLKPSSVNFVFYQVTLPQL